MGNKQGISLIVLVITIIVMIILAGAIILTLSNTGIIEKASYAIDVTNLNEIKEVANLLWADAYAAGARRQNELAINVVNGLNKIDGLNVNDYIVTVTTSGVTVEKANYVYYSTLLSAVSDVNNDTIGTNADATKTNAVAGLCVNNGKPYVVLLKDTVEAARIAPTADMTLNLGGHLLSANDKVGIDIISGNFIIDGTLEGSTIKITNTDSAAKPVQARPNTVLTINGGTYIANSDSEENAAIFVGGTTNIYDVVVTSYGTVGSISGIGNSAEGTVTILNSKITVTSIDGEGVGVFNEGKATIGDCDISANSTKARSLRCISEQRRNNKYFKMQYKFKI